MRIYIKTLIGALVRRNHAFKNIESSLHEVFGSLQYAGFALLGGKTTLRTIELWNLEFLQGINVLPYRIYVIHQIPHPANLWTVWWIAEMVYLYHKFVHDVAKNATQLNRLFKGVVFFRFGERIPANNRSYTDACSGDISFVGG